MITFKTRHNCKLIQKGFPEVFQYYATNPKSMNNKLLINMLFLTFINIVRRRAIGVQLRTGNKGIAFE